MPESVGSAVDELDDGTREQVRAGNRSQAVVHLGLGVGFGAYVAFARSDEPLWWGIAAGLVVTGLVHLGMTTLQVRAMGWAARRHRERRDRTS